MTHITKIAVQTTAPSRRLVSIAAAVALSTLGLTAAPAYAAGIATTTAIDCSGTFTYDGTAQEPCTYTVTENDGGTTVDSGSLSSGDYSNNTDAGTANASYSYPGDATYDPSSDSTTFEIGKADAVITVTAYNVTYDGSSHTATYTVTGVEAGGAATGTSMDVSGTTHTDAGSYTGDAWSFDGGTNYNNDSGTVDDVIGKADAVISVTPYTVTYDGSSHTATVDSITGVNGETGATVGAVDVTGTTHTAAGTYTDSWTFTPTANYNDYEGSTEITDTINTATVGSGTYTGAIAVPYGARAVLNSSFSIPTGCPTDTFHYEFSNDSGTSWPWYTSTGSALRTVYTTDVMVGGLPSGAYDVRAHYEGDVNCDGALSDTPGFVVYDASTSAYGGGQYVNNGRANFGFEYHAASRLRPASGNLVWNWKGQWRFKGKLSAYGKRTSGTMGGKSCSQTNPCGALSGSGTLSYWDGLVWVPVGNSIVVNVAAIQTTTTAKSTSPGWIGLSFGYAPTSGQPSLPSNALISLQKSNNGGGGVISLK